MQGLILWRQRGYQVELAPGYDGRWGYLAGTDVQRRNQLRQAWLDPGCKGILCVRGGYGGARLLEDWTWPPSEPKWLIGFSDVTALLWSLGQQGISGVHGPVLTTLALEPAWSIQRLFDWVEGKGQLAPLRGQGWGGGKVQGLLLPANLTVATHLLNTPVQPSLENVILALEDVGESPYRLDRMLTQWRMSGALGQVRGIALGRFSQCEPPGQVPSFEVREVLKERLLDLGLPLVMELPFGHDGANACLPLGVMAQLDGDRGTLAVLPGG
ncbi:MAG: LD-carboxypeptidase [Synechococcales cyanobacterium RM1_1_8]|nr:LD-carboxypeptidase [Synechococcales cyanobacterium RM1_1_8]